jgi:protein phosphatase PTC1
VQGLIAVTRSLGDSMLHPFVIADPHISTTQLTSEDEFLVIGCDGLWDIVSEEEMVEIVKKEMDDPKVAAEKLRAAAYDGGSTDNISVVVVFLQQKPFRKNIENSVDSKQEE